MPGRGLSETRVASSERNSDADKLASGARLRKETTMHSIQAIRARVRLGASKRAKARMH